MEGIRFCYQLTFMRKRLLKTPGRYWSTYLYFYHHVETIGNHKDCAFFTGADIPARQYA